jgi:phospholipase C
VTEALPPVPPADDATPPPGERWSRRSFLGGALVTGLAVAGTKGAAARTAARQSVLGGAALRFPGSRPFPKLPVGAESLPQIQNIIVVMMENHSYDNYFGTLGRGDGFAFRHGTPVDSNPWSGHPKESLRAFHMPSECQLHGAPGQNWHASHTAWNYGRNNGFVDASGPVAMGYWTAADLPFYHSMARSFPVCDRWFCSTLCQTYPNRRFLLGGTANGLVSTAVSSLNDPLPPNGIILDQLDAHGISWANYYTTLPGTAVWVNGITGRAGNLKPIDKFFTDCAAGTLPAVTFVDPDFENASEEDPQNISMGEQFGSRVVNAVMHGPQWGSTVLLWMYDEHGGYYDHVPPPRAVRPDNVDPVVARPPGTPDAADLYDRYGFRVPAVVVSPFARKNYVSHVVHDHTSVLKLIETKWNLPALTYRDANADNLLDCLDFKAAAFRHPPTLAAPHVSTCTPGEVGGPIPPPSAIVHRNS